MGRSSLILAGGERLSQSIWSDLVKDKNDFLMAERIKPCQCFRREDGRIEFDGLPARSPIIVYQIGSAFRHIANGLDYKIRSSILRKQVKQWPVIGIV